MPWPTMNAPGQLSPRRESASSFSSTTVTSQSSRLSWSAIVEPTLPQPMISAFMCDRSVARSYRFERPLREGDDQDLGRRLPQDVVDGRREEARLAPPARRGAEHDQVRPALGGGLDDRVADRPGADGAAVHLDAVVGAERARLRERGGRLLLGVEQLGVERHVERHLDHVERLDRRAVRPARAARPSRPSPRRSRRASSARGSARTSPRASPARPPR